MRDFWQHGFLTSAALLFVCSLALPAFSQDAFAPVQPGPSAVMPAVTPAVIEAKLPEAPKPHKFFDSENLALFGATTLMQTADLVSTRMVIDRGGREQDPLAKPFVDHGIGTQVIASYAIGTGGMLLGAYWLHRSGHHRLERWLPITVAATEALASASNFYVLARGHIGPSQEISRPELL